MRFSRRFSCYLFADFIEQADTPPFLPEGLPEAVRDVASDAIHLLIEYQSTRTACYALCTVFTATTLSSWAGGCRFR